MGREAARRLGLPEGVQHSIYGSYEWWNGKGVPEGLRGGDIPLGARLAMLTSTAALLDSTAGVDRAVQVVRGGSGKLLDPELASHFADHAGALPGGGQRDRPS